MARIRTVKPDFWTDEILVRLPFEARLLFEGLWNFSDDYGFLWDEPDRLRLQIFPYDELDVEALLDLLVAAGRVARYDPGDERWFLHVTRFTVHQKVDHPARSNFPDPASCRRAGGTVMARRRIAEEHGCSPGQSVEARCAYCGEPGRIHWWVDERGLRTQWVSFSGLEIDNPMRDRRAPEYVLACRECNRNAQSPVPFQPTALPVALEGSGGLASPREDSGELAKTLVGGEEEGKGRESTSSSANSETDFPVDATPLECKALEILRSIPRFPFDVATDLAMLRGIASEEGLQSINLAQAAFEWSLYKSTRPLTANSSARQQFLNYVKQIPQFAAERAKRAPAKGRKPGDKTGGKGGSAEPKPNYIYAS